MIIVSQDKKSIINFDRIKIIELNGETDFNNVFACIG